MTLCSSEDAVKMVARACPVCDSGQARVLRTQKFVLAAGHPLRDGYEVVACCACGFVYADTSATQRDYDEFYARHSKYDEAAIATGSGAFEADRARMRQVAQDIAPFISRRDASILDVGCATGGLLQQFKSEGFEDVLGLDPSPASAAWAREHFGIEIVTGSLFEAPPIEPRDVVLCSHVLEHVRDLQGAARQLYAWVKPGGLLYIEVPDAARYADFLAAPFQDFNTEHINHFGLGALRDLLEPRGLSLLQHSAKQIEAAPGVPYPALWALWRRTDSSVTADSRSSERDAGADAASMSEAMRRYIDASQVQMDAMDARLSAALPAGTPIVVWGTGELMMKLLNEPALSGADIRCFVDGNALNHGRMLRGVPIASPEQAARIVAKAGAAWPIVIGSTIHQRAITRRIRDELRWSNPIITLAP